MALHLLYGARSVNTHSTVQALIFLLDISINHTSKNVSGNTDKTEIIMCETTMSCMVVLSNIA